MSNTKLDSKLSRLWEGKIEKLEFDVLNHTISFKVKVFKSEDDFELFDMVFDGVSSFYFVQNIGKDRFSIFDPEPGDYKELTSIGWYLNGIGQIQVTSVYDKWAAYWHSSANFALELGLSPLFIEAKSVSINNKKFEVGYPSQT